MYLYISQRNGGGSRIFIYMAMVAAGDVNKTYIR